MKLKSKEEIIEAIEVIDKTLLKLLSPQNATRQSQGDKFTDDLIAQIKRNREDYIKQLNSYEKM